jgi:hypothetical protein
MHACSAVDEQFRPGFVQGRQSEFHPPLEQLCGFGLKVIIRRIPKDIDAVRRRQRGVVELNLHVDDVRHSRPRHRRHVVSRPNPAPNRNAVSEPRHVHPGPVSGGLCARLNASTSADNFARPENLAARGEIASAGCRRISLRTLYRFILRYCFLLAI